MAMNGNGLQRKSEDLRRGEQLGKAKEKRRVDKPCKAKVKRCSKRCAMHQKSLAKWCMVLQQNSLDPTCNGKQKSCIGQIGTALAMVCGALAMMGNAWACNRVAMGSADK